MKNYKLPILNKEAEETGERPIKADFLGLKASPLLINQAVRSFLSNQRSALAKTKRRGQIKGTTAKVWKQKGTGRARHGDRKAPIFVGGGKAHGPTGKQNYRLKINKKMTQRAIFSVLSQKIDEKKIFLLADLDFSKTKQAAKLVQKIEEKLSITGKIVLLTGKKEEVQKFFRKLSGVEVRNAGSVNVYHLMRGEVLLITEKGLSELIKEN